MEAGRDARGRRLPWHAAKRPSRAVAATDTDAVNIRYGKLAVGLWDRFVSARDFLAAVEVLADAKNREVAQRCAARIAAAKPNAARLASLRRIMKSVEKEIKDLRERASQNKAYARGKWREARAEMLAEARARGE